MLTAKIIHTHSAPNGEQNIRLIECDDVQTNGGRIFLERTGESSITFDSGDFFAIYVMNDKGRTVHTFDGEQAPYGTVDGIPLDEPE